RALDDELEGAVRVDGDHHRHRDAAHLLRAVVELGDELPDVHAVLAQGRADRRGWRRLPPPGLQPDLGRHLSRHVALSSSARSKPAGGLARNAKPPAACRSYTSSTCQYSSSTGTGRPKMVSSTRTRLLASRSSLTSPSMPAKVPSLTLTRSPRSNFGFAWATPGTCSPCRPSIRSTSWGGIGCGG